MLTEKISYTYNNFKKSINIDEVPICHDMMQLLCLSGMGAIQL